MMVMMMIMMNTIWVLGFGAAYIRGLTVYFLLLQTDDE